MVNEATSRGPARDSAFTWNAGAWFGSQLGCTLWLLILGAVLHAQDPISAWLCLLVFAALNLWGLFLWRSRDRLRAYAALQRFLLAASLLIGLVVVILNARGASALPDSGAMVSTYLPYGLIAVAPALMLMFHWQERKFRERRK